MMKRAMAWIIAALLTLLCGAALADDIEIRASGTGTVRMRPDVVTVSASAQTMDKSAGKAQEQVGKIVQEATNKLIELGVGENDIVTTSYSFYTSYNYSTEPPTFDGYNAYHSLQITCRDVGMLDAVVNLLTDCGVTQLDDISFGVSDNSLAYRKALELAIEDATDKAQAMAKAAGAKTLRIEQIEEYTGYDMGIPRAYSKDFDESAGTGIRSGDVSVCASVTVIFEAE